MPSPKCPSCGTEITKARLEKIETDTQSTKLFGPLPPYGLAYVCPDIKCNVLLPIWPQIETQTKNNTFANLGF
jgi:hypothetical protein